MNHSILLFHLPYCHLLKICYMMKITNKTILPGCYHEYVSVYKNRTTNLRLSINSKIASSTMIN